MIEMNDIDWSVLGKKADNLHDYIEIFNKKSYFFTKSILEVFCKIIARDTSPPKELLYEPINFVLAFNADEDENKTLCNMDNLILKMLQEIEEYCKKMKVKEIFFVEKIRLKHIQDQDIEKKEKPTEKIFSLCRVCGIRD